MKLGNREQGMIGPSGDRVIGSLKNGKSALLFNGSMAKWLDGQMVKGATR